MIATDKRKHEHDSSPASHRFLEELVQTQSFSGQERAAAEVCAKRMRELGYKYVDIDSAGNVVGANYDYRKDPNADLLLFSHLDTVAGFWPVKTDNEGISGRGAVDAKGCVASYIEASANPPEGIKLIVAGVTEEEAPISVGIRELLKYIKPKYAVNGEPSNCDGITIAYKGRILVHASVRGESAHAGMKTENPIEKLVEYQQKLSTEFPRNHAFESVIFNITHIEYGKKNSLNSIPDSLDFFIDVRIPPTRSTTEIRELLISLAPAGLKIDFENTEQLSGCEISLNDPLVRRMVGAARSQKITPRYLRKSGSADMNITMDAKIPTIAYGPGDSKLDHTDREYLRWSDYELAILVLKDLIKQTAAVRKEEE
ncbi:M20/M25/M40 family metallo-hydrolase [Candidatus Micrarchaeota archaeon]|nr:M20/M25/M40 family metallo-hydrolase [Candidatus Micrarchaeota archaeon]